MVFLESNFCMLHKPSAKKQSWFLVICSLIIIFRCKQLYLCDDLVLHFVVKYLIVVMFQNYHPGSVSDLLVFLYVYGVNNNCHCYCLFICIYLSVLNFDPVLLDLGQIWAACICLFTFLNYEYLV